MKKYIITAILFLLGIYVSLWIFNHGNEYLGAFGPWFGIVCFLLTFGFTINYFIKTTKN
jgi:hypothetical protein